MRRSSLPTAVGSNPAAPAASAPLVVVPTTAGPPAAMAASAAVSAPASHPPSATAPAPRRYYTRVGPTPPSPPHPRPPRRAPRPREPEPRAQKSPPAPGLRNHSRHPIRALLEPLRWTCPQPPSSDGHFSTTTLFQGMLIAVRGTCMMRFIMIFLPFSQTRSSETRCS